MLFDNLSDDAKKNAVQAFSDYFDDEVSQRMLESVKSLEDIRSISFSVMSNGDGGLDMEPEKGSTPCFSEGHEMPSKPVRLKPTDDTVDQVFCEEYNKHVGHLMESWKDIRRAMRQFPNALSALEENDRFMSAWEDNLDDYSEAVYDAADDMGFGELEAEFEDMAAVVRDAIDGFADDDLDATEDALDAVSETLDSESDRYKTREGVSRLSREMGIDFDEDGNPVGLFEKTSSNPKDVEYALTRRIPAPVDMQEDTGVCPLCHSDAFDGKFCPVCGFHGNPSNANYKNDKDGGEMAITLAYMLKHGSKKTAQDNATIYGMFGSYGYAVIADGNAYYCQDDDELEGTLWAISFGDDVKLTVDFDSMPDGMDDIVREIYRVFDVATMRRAMAPGISDVLGVSVYALSKAYTYLD